MPVTQAYFDLIDAFGEPGCAVCRLALRDVQRYLEALLYEYTTDYDVYQAFRRSRGLCNTHTAQFIRFTGSAPGMSVLAHGALSEILQQLEPPSLLKSGGRAGLRRLLAPGDSASAALAQRLAPRAGCPACATLHDAEQRYTIILHDHPEDTRLLAAYRASDGLCVPHLRRLLRQEPAAPHLAVLVATQQDIWQRLRAELEAFLHKDGSQSAQAGSESDSRLRALLLLAGQPGILEALEPWQP